MLTRSALLDGLAKQGDDAAVLDAMERDVLRVGPEMMLEDLLDVMRDRPRCPVVVVENGRVVGLITFEELVRFFEVARRLPAPAPAP